MKRILPSFLLAVACVLICSCKGRTGQASSSAHTEIVADMETVIKSFYTAYCTDWDGESKTDSILSQYCTEELRDCVMDCVGEYDFVLDGGIYASIDIESFRVIKKNEKYIVCFEYAKWPVSDEPGRDSVYVTVNKENRIAYIIRPSDNYRVPNIYSNKSPLLYYYELQYVDLGLSVNWATCNIGSRSVNPGWQGDWFAWGETVARDNFARNTYFAPKQDRYYEGKLTVLESSDDAATVLWGPDWRMPTKEEFQELVDNCTWEWTERDGTGYKVTGKNGNSIFLPVGGMKMGNRWTNYYEGLYYWTSSCKFDDPEREPKAWMFYSVADGPDRNKNRRMGVVSTPLSVQVGRQIRPVTTKPYVPICDIGLNKKKLELEIGEEYVLTASFIPKDATPKNLYWHSGNSAIACVDRNGKVTAVAGGKCAITAVCGEMRKECQVTVNVPTGYTVEPQEVITIFEFGKEVNGTFVDGFQEYPDSLKLKEVFKTHVGGKQDGFSVTLSGFTYDDECGDCDPGDYSMITIETAGGKFQFRNSDWVSNDIFENHYFYCHRIDKSKYLLFFRGFDYGCCPGILTVLAVDATGVRVVYNKECYLNEINKDPFSMTTDSWGSEYVSKYKTNYSDSYNLFVEDGALKQKQVWLLHDY